MDRINLQDLVRGKTYRVVYKLDTQRKPRYSVMRYIKTEPTSWTSNETYWDARPYAGTQSLNARTILAIVAVDDKTPIIVGKMV
jgi:hypothetical protein